MREKKGEQGGRACEEEKGEVGGGEKQIQWVMEGGYGEKKKGIGENGHSSGAKEEHDDEREKEGQTLHTSFQRGKIGRLQEQGVNQDDV